MKKLYMLIVALLCCCVLACPVYAADSVGAATSETAISDDELLGIGGDLSDAMDEYGSELPGLMDDVKDQVDETTGDMGQVSEFFGYTLGAVIQSLPASFAVYLVLFCVLLAVVGIVRVLTE